MPTKHSTIISDITQRPTRREPHYYEFQFIDQQYLTIPLLFRLVTFGTLFPMILDVFSTVSGRGLGTFCRGAVGVTCLLRSCGQSVDKLINDSLHLVLKRTFSLASGVTGWVRLEVGAASYRDPRRKIIETNLSHRWFDNDSITSNAVCLFSKVDLFRVYELLPFVFNGVIVTGGEKKWGWRGPSCQLEIARVLE
ncbi:hypothetical protein J6590_077078 [Homalodisca vitripennis]|nr:hypothetical protein J6590_077078 [Homalodisca vitripennis]